VFNLDSKVYLCNNQLASIPAGELTSV
uniref:Uncharacterized protein n=1 Tax=Petromyzon marinus TaxID=7757 RepID=S4S0L2_PETMA